MTRSRSSLTLWGIVHLSVVPQRGQNSAQTPELEVAPDVVAAMAGDRQATERVVRRLIPRIRNLIRYFVYRDSDVDDLAQDALVAVLRGLPSYRGEGRFESWVDRIVARIVFARFRERRQIALAPIETRDDQDFAIPNGEEYLSRRESVRALDRLSAEQRHAVVFHYVLDKTVPEIAEELQISTETVRSRLRLGKTRLREIYERSLVAKGKE